MSLQRKGHEDKHSLGREYAVLFALLLREWSVEQYCCCSWNESPFDKQVPGQPLFHVIDSEQLLS